jgi:hypothetical protein
MGLDVEIFVKLKDASRPLHQLDADFALPEGYKFRIGTMYNGATHRIYTLDRYYGKTYERGPWPTICGVLMKLIQDPNVEKVWYMSDCSIPDDLDLTNEAPTDIAEVLDISKHYMVNGTRPYHDKAPRIYVDELSCPTCGKQN